MESSNRRSIAFFDLDGTITRKDTFIHFLIFDRGLLNVMGAFLRLAPLALTSASKSHLKETLFSMLYKHKPEQDVRAKGYLFSKKILPGMLRPSALQKMQWHLAEGHEVCIVSASSSIWLKGLADDWKVNLIATEYEVADGLFTGRYVGNNCKGPEKVARIRQAYDIQQYAEIYAYGDSEGDTEMLGIATQKFYKVFND